MPSSTSQSRRRRLLWLNTGLLVLGLGTVAGLWALLLGTLQAERTQSLAAGLRQVQGLAHAYEAQTQQLLQRVDLVTRLAAREAEAGHRNDAVSILRQGLAGERSLIGGYVIDAKGDVVAATVAGAPANVSDRPHFRVHAERPTDGLFVSMPVLGRVSGRWVVQLSRRLSAADGRFAGVLVVSADPAHFTNFYGQAQLPPGSMTLLTGTDGVVRARRSGGELWFGGSQREGRAVERFDTAEGVALDASPFDGVRRVVAHRPVAGHPLTVAVGLAEDEVLATHRRREAALRSLGAVVTAVLVLAFGALAVLVRRWRISQAHADALQVEFAAASEASLDAFFILRAVRDHAGRIVDFVYVHANERGARLVRSDRTELIGRRRSQVPAAAGDARFFELYCRVIASGQPAEATLQVGPPEDDGPWMLHQIVPVGDGVALTSHDVTAQREREQEILAAQHALRDSEQRLRDITDNLPVLIAYIDREERLMFANATARRWFGLDVERAIGRPLRELLGEDHYLARRDPLRRALAGERMQFEVVSMLQGRPLHLQMTYVPDRDADGRVLGVYGLSADVTELKQIQARLDEMAHHDAVTGLPNRNRFDEVLPLAIKRAGRSHTPLALMFLDIDHFKRINDTWGHGVGDGVLREFGRRLQDSVRATDTVARLAGDEFVVLLEGVAGAPEAERIAAKIVERVRQPMQVDGVELEITTSIGIALHEPSSPVAPATLLRVADEALYRTKSGGRDGWQLTPV